MSNNKSQRRTVVLDGSNIVGNAADGNDGRILVSAIEYYENLGFNVIPVMKSGTIGRMKAKKEPGFGAILNMAKSKELRTPRKNDDEGVIQIALKRDGWIVTHDTFSREKTDKDGNTIPPEREKYPDWPWDDIDERTRGTERGSDGRIFSGHHWYVDGTDFHDDTMQKAPKELLSSEYTEFRRDLQVVTRRIDRITVFLAEAEPGELTKLMSKKVSKIRKEITKVMEMIPASHLPEDAAVDKFLVAECKQLIKLINDIDEEAKLTLSGTKDELRARIKEYTAKARVHRAQLEAEENTRLEAKRAEKEAAEEAGISLSKYRKSQRKKAKAEGREKAKEATLEKKRKILEGKTADEISSIVNGSFEEILGDDFKGDLSVSLDIKDLQINCKSSLGRKRNRILIGKSGSTIKQVAKQISEKLGLDWIRVNIA